MRSRVVKLLVLVVLVATALSSCKDRDAEKKIAELQSQIDELKSEKAKNTASTPLPTSEPVKEEKPEGPLPVAEFAKVEHDFGTINEGQSVEYTFKVKNTGEAPLIIQKADPSCGCTVPDWTKEPIAPGASGFVKAKFDSSGKPGKQNKSITVTANTWPKQTVLRFKADVTPKASGQDGPVK